VGALQIAHARGRNKGRTGKNGHHLRKAGKAAGQAARRDIA